MTKKSFKRLSPQEFDADLLQELTNEGCVYIQVSQCVDKDMYKHEVLNYVESIHDFAAEEWRDEIDSVWREIVDAACMSEFLILKKGSESGHMNRYAVTHLVCRLQHAGVYRKDVTMLSLHLRLEHTNQKNKYYKGCREYKLCREGRNLLKSLFMKVKNDLIFAQNIVP